jgi:hypothetical protein
MLDHTEIGHKSQFPNRFVVFLFLYVSFDAKWLVERMALINPGINLNDCIGDSVELRRMMRMGESRENYVSGRLSDKLNECRTRSMKWETTRCVGLNLTSPCNLDQCTSLSGTAICRSCFAIYRRECSVAYRNIPSVSQSHMQCVTTALCSNLVETSRTFEKSHFQ